jgi:hypothetical protein
LRDHHRLDLHAGEHGHVLQHQVVVRISDRHHERVLVLERHRNRPHPPGRCERHELRGARVKVDLVQAPVLEPEALRHGDRKLVGGDGAVFEQRLPNLLADLTRRPRGLFDRLTITEAEFHDDVAEPRPASRSLLAGDRLGRRST